MMVVLGLAKNLYWFMDFLDFFLMSLNIPVVILPAVKLKHIGEVIIIGPYFKTTKIFTLLCILRIGFYKVEKLYWSQKTMDQ